jgi:hypothetical protein
VLHPTWFALLPHPANQDQHADTIWEGDVKEFSRAYDLICLMDQVHDFAANQHRKFVIKHLEPWLRHAEERSLEFMALQPNGFPEVPAEPVWSKIKEASKQARNTRAAETRSQNRLKKQNNARDCHSQKGRTTETLSATEIQLQPKRPRGRPKKCATEIQLQPKRPRGRPKKCAKTSAIP